MYPILYENITAGQIPQHNGLGILSDVISCYVEQERNGKYELTMEYAATGIHSEEISQRRIIKVKPNFTDNPQLFRIDRIGKTMNGKFTVYGKHISYDLSGYEITSGTASSASGACLLLQNKADGYSITTDKTTSASFKITEPSSVRSWFGGKQGSFLDVFGGADIKYDNFNIQFLQNAGQDRGVTIRYGKNLLEISQEIQDSLYTHVMCFWKNDDAVVTGDKVSTGLTLDVPKTLIVDCSQDYESAPSVTDLTNKATAYKNSHNLTVPSNNIKLDFEQSEQLSERVDLCDTVSIYYEALGITRVNAKCIRTKFDCIREKYVETEFGDAQADLSDTLANASKSLSKMPTTSFMQEAIAHATEMITGNLGGYVILHDANGDGYPDEILIMDTDSIDTASQIWRWNKNGLGFATSYSGSYGTAITQDGKIVADYVSTGVLNANLIKAGVISDTNGNSSIDMTSGKAKLKELTAKTNLELVDSNNVRRAFLQYTGTEPHFSLLTGTAKIVAEIWGNTQGGQFGLSDTNGNRRVDIWIDSYNHGNISLYNESGDAKIRMYGSGEIVCVSVTQTSSRKVKDNIKPIEDSNKILGLQAVSFDYKEKAQGTNKRGFIAEDVAEILPNLVSEGDIPALDYIGMIPYLQDVIKKQEARIAELEKKMEKLYNADSKGE